jgi:ABC-type glutathione transport system ATPase component
VLLQINDVTLEFRSDGKTPIRALDGATLEVDRDEVVGLVGESGAGKSMIARTVLQLLPSGGEIVGGEVLYEMADGEQKDLMSMSERELRERVRGTEIAMIFQNPKGSLNPVRPVGRQIKDVLRLHHDFDGKKATDEVASLLSRVEISPDRSSSYAMELSGGQAQRVAIARAIACRPRLLIADEPTSALDVVTQKRIFELLTDLQADFGMGTLLISHDLQLVANVADRIVVLKEGSVVEEGQADRIYESPGHDYTRTLRSAIPEMAE